MKKALKIILVSLAVLSLLVVSVAIMGYRYFNRPYEGKTKRIYLSAGITSDVLHTTLIDSLGNQFGQSTFEAWLFRRANVSRAHGSYLIKTGETPLQLSSRLRGGVQDPVRTVVPNRRKLDEAITTLSSYFEFSEDEFSFTFDSLLNSLNVSPENRAGYLLPDSYDFYWTSHPSTVAQRLIEQHDKFWNNDRKEKASALGLAPEEVVTLASIVEEETSKTDERPLVARLYLNRLKKGMRLQADPTVKYAVGDPTLKRILNAHLSTASPYNTYIIDGLPPGPIRMVDKSTIDAVLNAPKHDFLYMCAKEDFSGYHNFAKTLAEHNANASRYHNALNSLKIK